MSDRSTALLADLVAKRHACLTQLKAIGLKQAELIATSQISELLRLLSGKQQLIAALQTIEQRLAPFHEEDPENRSWPSAKARADCAQQADQCRLLLAEVLRLEQTNEQQMTLRRDEVAAQLQTAAAATKARGAYRRQQKPPPSAASTGDCRLPMSSPSASPSQLDLTSEA